MRLEQVHDLDDVLGLARNATPSPLDELELRRLARAALAHSQKSPEIAEKGKVARRSWLLAAASLLLTVLSLGWYADSVRPRGTAIEVGRDDLALRLALRPGDVVIAAPDTALRIVAQELFERRVELERGAALFDVVPLAAGQSFQVDTPHARLRVLGTVFSAEVAAGRTIVRVYEGRVFVAGRTLGAGEVWASDGKVPGAHVHAPLAAEARQHARARGMFTAPPQPSVEPQPVATSLTKSRAWPGGVARDAPSAARVYAEATRRLYSLGDAASAVALLDAYDLDAETAPLRERATVLRVDALLMLGRLTQAAEVARRYVLREPETHTSTRMRNIAAGLVAPITVRE